MNYKLRFVLSILFFCIFHICSGVYSVSLSLLEMLVNLSQYRGSVGIFNNRNIFVPSKVSHFTNLSDNNNNNNNLVIVSLILLNKIALVLFLLNLMFVFKGSGSKHKKIIFI